MPFKTARSRLRSSLLPKTRRPRAARSSGRALLFLARAGVVGVGVVFEGVDEGVGEFGCEDDGEEGRSRSGVVGPKYSTILR